MLWSHLCFSLWFSGRHVSCHACHAWTVDSTDGTV